MTSSGALRLAIPSSGALYEPTMLFLRSCGIGISRTSNRRYTAEMPSLPGVSVMFQRMADITNKVDEGTADAGIVGLDRFLETNHETGDINLVNQNLGFGHCELVVGVPDFWADVSTLADLSDLSLEFREQGTDMRIATKFPRLVERFLLRNGIGYFSLVQSSGTLEVAPAMGYADIIVDISSSGTTLKENRLKTIRGGTILISDACLIINKVSLAINDQKRDLANRVVKIIEEYLESQKLYDSS